MHLSRLFCSYYLKKNPHNIFFSPVFHAKVSFHQCSTQYFLYTSIPHNIFFLPVFHAIFSFYKYSTQYFLFIGIFHRVVFQATSCFSTTIDKTKDSSGRGMISVMSVINLQWPMHLSMLFCTFFLPKFHTIFSFYQYSTQYLSKQLADFPHNHCKNNGQQLERNEYCHNDFNLRKKNGEKQHVACKEYCAEYW